MSFILALIILFPTLAMAELQLNLAQSERSREYFLLADTCDELKSELSYFERFVKNYGAVKRLSRSLDCKSKTTGSVSLKNFLPINIEKLINTFPEYYGPNCWNSVIFANGISHANRFFTDGEFEKTLNYYQCQKRTITEKIQPGDIIRILNQKHEDYHAFIYISPNYSFTKNGPETRFAYSLDKTSSIFWYYGVDKDCFDSQAQLINKKCADFVKIYNCQKRIEPKIPNPDGLGVMINEVDVRMTYLILNYRHFPSNDARANLMRDLEQKLNSLYFIINNDLTNGKLDAETFAREDYYFSKVLSLKEQLSYF